jgi:hypothetical protein
VVVPPEYKKNTSGLAAPVPEQMAVEKNVVISGNKQMMTMVSTTADFVSIDFNDNGNGIDCEGCSSLLDCHIVGGNEG